MKPYIAEAWTILVRFLTNYGIRALGALAILAVGWIVSTWASRAAHDFAQRNKHLGPTLAPVLGTFSRIAVLAATVVAVLTKLGVDTTGLVAALGALGLGVGLALKDTLSDIAAGIVVLILRPFEVGHDVDLNGIEGTVASVDVFETRLVGFDGVPVVIPNKKVREGRIRNYTAAERRRMELTVGIAYGAAPQQAIAAIEALLDEDERVLADPPPIVGVSSLADSSVNLVIRFWISPTDWFITHNDIRRKLKRCLDDAAIPIPFPQREITIVERKVA